MCTDAYGEPNMTTRRPASLVERASQCIAQPAVLGRAGGLQRGEVGSQLIDARGGRIELNLVDLLLHRGERREALVTRSPLAALLDQCFERIGHAAELTAVAVTLHDLHLGLGRAGVDAVDGDRPAGQDRLGEALWRQPEGCPPVAHPSRRVDTSPWPSSARRFGAHRPPSWWFTMTCTPGLGGVVALPRLAFRWKPGAAFIIGVLLDDEQLSQADPSSGHATPPLTSRHQA